ncbi:MAG: hypothetical protein JSW03_07975 [Candidatus Eiseniibacteriota bacterium]|nr:MAG: hypothetical protein JSW03_07975 [Candidatus Eisenbacteria bacterium]
MKALLILVVLSCLIVPALALAQGNASPRLFLEIFDFASMPSPVPDSVCNCSLVPPALLPCYSAKSSGSATGLLSVHVGQVENGFLGLPFGVTSSGGNPIFLTVTACAGFLKGPSQAMEPAAIIISSTGPCYQWRKHVGYLRYLAQSTNATYFNIVGNADLGHNWVINCASLYDQNTAVGGNAQWGGVQDVTCYGDPVSVETTTWGKIKGLFR